MASSTNMLRSAVRLFLLSLTLVWTQGFQHQTTYIQDMQPSCNHNVSDISGEVHSHRGSEETTYQTDVDCSVIINAQPGKRINIRFNFFDLPSTYQNTLKECKSDRDRVYIYNTGKITRRGGERSRPEATLCGGTGKFPDDYQSSGSVVMLKFVSDKYQTQDKGFKFIYTQFVPQSDDETDCFNCETDDMCISQDLVCNKINNCNDDSDESRDICEEESKDVFFGVLGVGVVAIVVATIGVVFLIILIVCIVCCCKLRKSNNNQKDNSAASRPASYPNHSPVPRYATQAPPPLPPPPTTSPYPPHVYQMYNGHGPPHHHPGPGVMYHHSHESVDLPQKI